MPKPNAEPSAEKAPEAAAERAEEELSDDDLGQVSGGISLITPAVQSARALARRTQ
jgi:hypothetical protein